MLWGLVCNVNAEVAWLLVFILADEKTEEEKKAEETELFTKYYTEWRGGGERDSSYKTIPRFYYRVGKHYIKIVATPSWQNLDSEHIDDDKDEVVVC